jgi:hypothetical protein
VPPVVVHDVSVVFPDGYRPSDQTLEVNPGKSTLNDKCLKSIYMYIVQIFSKSSQREDNDKLNVVDGHVINVPTKTNNSEYFHNRVFSTVPKFVDEIEVHEHSDSSQHSLICVKRVISKVE